MALTLAQGLQMLEGRGPVLEVAREVSSVLRDRQIEGGVVGGVAVALHGRVRSTVDVDVLIARETERFAAALRESGFDFDAARREFMRHHVPVHMVTAEQAGARAMTYLDIDGVRTISLADLVNMKLRSGRDNLLRARDLADAIDLIRVHGLGGAFTGRIDPDLRADYRRIVAAVEGEAGTPGTSA